jgi:hypothetical protein
MERDLPALEFEAVVIPAIVPEPQRQKDCGHEDAVENHGGGQFEHVTSLQAARPSPSAQRNPGGLAGPHERLAPEDRRRAKKKTRRANARRVANVTLAWN